VGGSGVGGSGVGVGAGFPPQAVKTRVNKTITAIILNGVFIISSSVISSGNYYSHFRKIIYRFNMILPID
jgi:hypothetical protein